MVLIKRSIWKDPGWLDLSVPEQLYAIACMTFRSTGPITDARIARRTGWPAEMIASSRSAIADSKWAYLHSMQPKRRKLPVRTRTAVFERDGYACRHCRTLERLTVDHIFPFSRGGDDDLDNLQTLCHSCNAKKGARV